MKVLIIEDERRSINRLIKMVDVYDPTIEIVGKLDSVKKAILWFEENAFPELIFMDIQLADGECFEIFEVTQINIPIIFITAYDKYAIQAFKVNSIDYLLKPFSYQDVEAALNKLKLVSSQAVYPTKEIIKSISYKGRFLVKNGHHIYSIPVNDIVCFFSQDKMTYLCTHDNRKYILDESLDQLEACVSPEIFYRVNRKYLININFIQSIDILDTKLKVKMEKFKEEEDIVVSRDKAQGFKILLDK